MEMRRAVAWVLALMLLVGSALAEESADALVASYLAQMQCPGACSYVGAIIELYPATRDALLTLEDRALPELARILEAEKPGRYRSMAEIFLMEILGRGEGVEGKSEAVLANEAMAKAAVEVLTGKPYKPLATNPNWAKK